MQGIYCIYIWNIDEVCRPTSPNGVEVNKAVSKLQSLVWISSLSKALQPSYDLPLNITEKVNWIVVQ